MSARRTRGRQAGFDGSPVGQRHSRQQRQQQQQQQRYDSDSDEDHYSRARHDGYDDPDAGVSFGTLRRDLNSSLDESQRAIQRMRGSLSHAPQYDDAGSYAYDDDDEDGQDGLEDDPRSDVKEWKQRQLNKREHELLREIDRLKQIIDMQQRAQSAPDKLSRTPLRPPSRSSRKEYLQTRGRQEELDRKMDRTLHEAHTVTLRNRALMDENSQLRQEVAKLRKENTDLLLFAKDFQTDSRLMQAQIVTNVAHRAQLAKRLDRTVEEKHRLETDLTRMTDRFIQKFQDDRYEQDLQRWAHINEMQQSIRPVQSPRRASKPYRTRNIRVEEW